MIQQKFAGTHQELVKKIQGRISQEAKILNTIKMTTAPAASGSSHNNRTMASPEWQNDGPVNWQRHLNLPSISLADFEAGNTHHQFDYDYFLKYFVWDLRSLSTSSWFYFLMPAF